MERNDSVAAVAVGKETSSTPPLGKALAIELFVVPKSMPWLGWVVGREGMAQKTHSKSFAKTS
jgi:hypothetical protein